MFRLLKLSAYLLLGYAFYQFAAGLLQIEDEKYRRDHGANPGRDPGAGGKTMNFTGPGQGQEVSTLETDGSSASHLVGRGVVAR